MRSRFIIYCPPQFRGPPRFNACPIMRMGEHSRPVYRVLDRAKLAKGNNPEAPEHTTALIVAEELDYIEATKKADELNAKPGAQRVVEVQDRLDALGIESGDALRLARWKLDEAEQLLFALSAFNAGNVGTGSEYMHAARGFSKLHTLDNT